MIINHLPDLIANKFGGADKVNISQVQRETGLNYSTVFRWMKNRVDRADFPILAIWCKYLGVGVGEIIEYKNGG